MCWFVRMQHDIGNRHSIISLSEGYTNQSTCLRNEFLINVVELFWHKVRKRKGSSYFISLYQDLVLFISKKILEVSNIPLADH